LKIQGLGVAPVSAMGVTSAAGFQVSLIVAELCLGLWLTSGLVPVGSWFTAFLAFTNKDYEYVESMAGVELARCSGSRRTG
jgi:hypothetical protein